MGKTEKWPLYPYKLFKSDFFSGNLHPLFSQLINTKNWNKISMELLVTLKSVRLLTSSKGMAIKINTNNYIYYVTITIINIKK